MIVDLFGGVGTDSIASPNDADFPTHQCNSLPALLPFKKVAYETLQTGAIPHFVASFASLAGIAFPFSSLFNEPGDTSASAGLLFGSSFTPFVSGF